MVAYCEVETGKALTSPAALQEFSVADFRRFWELFVDWSNMPREGSESPACSDDRCEVATFFPNLRLNYAECLLGAGSDHEIALIAHHDDRPPERVTRGELRSRARSAAIGLERLGVGVGDRVAAIARNDVEAVVGALAAATTGATFSSASPEMGEAAILSRFEQLAPKLLMAGLQGRQAGVAQADRVATVAARLPSLVALVALDDGPVPERLKLPVHRLTADAAGPTRQADGEWRRFPFNQPLFVLFTSGTTGPPKCLVHGAGGTLLEHLKEHRLHLDLSPGDTLFFHTTAAWMMWNWQLSALASGATVVLYDGQVSGPSTLWEIVADERVTVFGTSPPYLQLCEDRGYSPRQAGSLDRLRSVLSTGSVLRDWQFEWLGTELPDARLQSISGGTDIVGCFVLGHPWMPIRQGMIQSRSLGLDVDSLQTDSSPADSGIGELICRNPFPSRPLGILGDDDGSRFHDAYFAANPGVWTHGDLIEFNDDGQSRIHGRSDGVLNIQGVRIGPAEIYQALREVPEVEEALAVEQTCEEGESKLVLLVVPREGTRLDGAVSSRIRRTIARQTTPLHVPKLIVAVDELPRTHSGKRSARAAADAVSGREPPNLGALANPDSVTEIRSALLAVNMASGSAPEGPRGETEAELRSIWEQLLGIEPIAGDEDFFALGGTSLLAVQLFLEIEQRLGPRLHLSTLLEAPTIGELAALLDDPDRCPQKLVLMRLGSDPKPLFLVHSLWGDVLGMRELTTAMKGDVPVYGLRVERDESTSWSGVTVESLATDYLSVIQEKQPQPPYRIAGHSFGALVAFEISRQFSELGLEVEWLGMIDGELNAACLPPPRRWGHRLALPFHFGRAAARNPVRALRAIARTPLAKIRRNPADSPLTPEALPGEPPEWMADAEPYYQDMALSFLAAAEAFRPLPYPGPMTYFVPRIRRFHLYADPVPVWKRVAPSDFELVPVPGPHVGMVSGSPASFIASVIDGSLR